jgi:hypothetical protein
MNRRNAVARVLGSLSLVGLPVKLFAAPVENESNKKVWVTRDGRSIRIVDMTDDHLRNTIFFLNRRTGQVSGGGIPFMHINKQGQVIGLGETTPALLWPIYDDLIREADRRKLSWTPSG